MQVSSSPCGVQLAQQRCTPGLYELVRCGQGAGEHGGHLGGKKVGSVTLYYRTVGVACKVYAHLLS